MEPALWIQSLVVAIFLSGFSVSFVCILVLFVLQFTLLPKGPVIGAPLWPGGENRSLTRRMKLRQHPVYFRLEVLTFTGWFFAITSPATILLPGVAGFNANLVVGVWVVLAVLVAGYSLSLLWRGPKRA